MDEERAQGVMAAGAVGSGMNTALAIIASAIARRTGTTAEILEDLRTANAAIQKQTQMLGEDVLVQHTLQQVISLLKTFAPATNSPMRRPKDR